MIVMLEKTHTITHATTHMHTYTNTHTITQNTHTITQNTHTNTHAHLNVQVNQDQSYVCPSLSQKKENKIKIENDIYYFLKKIQRVYEEK